jgi:hypothetical protein
VFEEKNGDVSFDSVTSYFRNSYSVAFQLVLSGHALHLEASILVDHVVAKTYPYTPYPVEHTGIWGR